jgi:transcriptional regulator with XRE-family HTH domain
MATLGETIRARREELGLTQEQLAERIGENARQADISRLEHDGVTLPRRERLEGLAAALDLDLGVLLSRSGWVGADRVIASAEPAVEPNPVELEDVLEKAKEVVIHL